MTLNYKTSYYSSISQFVKTNSLQDEFFKEFGMAIDDWDYYISDVECIEKLLDKTEGKFLVFYRDREDDIIVFETSEPI